MATVNSTCSSEGISPVISNQNNPSGNGCSPPGALGSNCKIIAYDEAVIVVVIIYLLTFWYTIAPKSNALKENGFTQLWVTQTRSI